MDVDWTFELVDQLESHWRNQLRPRLDGLTDDEYFWQPVSGCWTISRRSESSGEFTMDRTGSPDEQEPVTTIAWRLAHLIEVFGSPAVPHFDGPSARRPTIEYAGTADGALHQLDDGHDAWVRDVRAVGTSGLVRPQGALSPPEYADAPIARLVLYTHVEVIHHGAEVCLLRDLYRAKGARDHL